MGVIGPIGPMGPIGGDRRWCALLTQRGEHPEVGATDHNPVQRSCAGMGCLSRMRAEGTLLWCCGGSEGRTVGTLAIYIAAQARHNYVVPGYDQGCRFAALRCFGGA